MERFWKLFEESVIVQSVITLVLVSVTCYLLAVGRPIPELLSSALMLVLGFYFGSKTQHSLEARSRGGN